ncbi:uncharacterized protein BDW70DRAFT_13063 [Aspergillus foveolatus]|uniref:uncharacterized protein n=1 Tax=Aspergillus foveolatus TaxID=210207 RepID=UPI003CCDDD1F
MAMFIGPDTVPETRLFCHFPLCFLLAQPFILSFFFTLDLMKMISPHPSVCSAFSFSDLFSSHYNSCRPCDTLFHLSSLWSSFQYSCWRPVKWLHGLYTVIFVVILPIILISTPENHRAHITYGSE